MCYYTAIPGKTGLQGCLVGTAEMRSKKKTVVPAEKKVVVPSKVGPSISELILTDEEDGRYDRYDKIVRKLARDTSYRQQRRNDNAKNATRHRFARPSASRVSIRRFWFL